MRGNGDKDQRTTQPPQQPAPCSPSLRSCPYPPGWLAAVTGAGPPGRPVFCSCRWRARGISERSGTKRWKGAHVIVLADLADELAERVVDVDPLLRGGLNELAVEVLCQVPALCNRRVSAPTFPRIQIGQERGQGRTVHANLALVLEVALVRNDDDWEVVLILDAQDLLVECADLLEAVARGDRVDGEEALACAHVLLAHCPAAQHHTVYVSELCNGQNAVRACAPVLLLPGGIEHVEQRDLVVDHALLAVRVCPHSAVISKTRRALMNAKSTHPRWLGRTRPRSGFG